MSVLPHTSVQTASIVTPSSNVGKMPLTTRREASKEALEASNEKEVEVTKPTIHILIDTWCIIDKSTEVSRKDIKYTFM